MLSIEEIKNIVCPLAKKYEVDRVYLFGSYARGEATEKSDVDLCIDPGKLDGLEFCGFYVDLEEQLNCGIDLLTRRQLKKRFLENIQKEEILIYDRG